MPFEKLLVWLESEEGVVYVYSNGWLRVFESCSIPGTQHTVEYDTVQLDYHIDLADTCYL